ncbi:MAG: HEAT repeat domain-containing protein [Snowella sp.]|nr:HEAT repeat domain-containing protein [Snowella sp.]
MEQTVQSLIQTVDEADSAEKLVKAVRALAQLQHEAAIPTLTTVLRYNNPGAAIAAVDGLITLGKVTVPYLLENIDGYNYGARAWATRVLAGIGDPRALEVLIDAATSDFSFSVRRGAVKGLGNLKWQNSLETDIFPDLEKTFTTLASVALDTEWVVRYAAIAGLQSFAINQETLRIEVMKKLTELSAIETEFIVKTRILWALENLQILR